MNINQACKKGDLKAATRILANDPKQVNRKDVEYGEYPLHFACDADSPALVRLLLDYDANIDQCSDYGMTPVHLVSLLGLSDILELLIESGADLTLVDKYGQTALDIALDSELSDKKVIEILRKYGVPRTIGTSNS